MFLPLDASSGLPIYRQIVDQVRRMIAAGSLRPGERLASVRDLAAMLRVNALTVAKAYGELERAGVVETRRGLGVYVAAAPAAEAPAVRREAVRAAAERYALDAAQAGLEPREACRLLTESWPKTNVPEGSAGRHHTKGGRR
jgi:GntR family transcriptional regulator